MAGGYLKLERRVGDFATVGVAVALETSGATVTRAVSASPASGARPSTPRKRRRHSMGDALSAEGIERAATLAAEAARPISDHRGSAEYKRHVVHTFVERLLGRIAESAERAA